MTTSIFFIENSNNESEFAGRLLHSDAVGLYWPEETHSTVYITPRRETAEEFIKVVLKKGEDLEPVFLKSFGKMKVVEFRKVENET
jgi:hypothetical protein